MTSKPTAADRDARLEQVLADYLHADEAGQPLDHQQLLRQHPDLADELQSYFANRAAMQRLVEPLKGSAFDPTLGLTSGGAAEESLRVRYFGDYELLAELGRGGMGVVYRARQTTLNRSVALKMIISGQLASSDDVQRFRQEAEAAANLDHPHITPIYETGEHGGQHYFSMKLIEGCSLREALPELRLDVRHCVTLLLQVARAVHHAHQRGVLHRDLKPANILLDQESSPYVTDFGLAKHVEGGSDVTKTGAIVGTPSYMAPEQALGEKQLSTAVDIYSLGAILYEVLTGQPPFRADTPMETLLQVTSRDVARPSSINAHVDRDLETIVLKCLDKDSSRRYDSAAALADDLQRWLAGEPIVARRATPGERALKWARRRPAAAALLVVSGAALAGFLAMLLIGNDAIRRQRDLAQAARIAETNAKVIAERNFQRAQVARQAAVDAFYDLEAERERALDALARSKCEQARAVRLSGTAGRRWESLTLLREATRLVERPRTERAGESFRRANDTASQSESALPIEAAGMPTMAELRSEAFAALMLEDATTIRALDVGAFPPVYSADGRLAVVKDKHFDLMATVQGRSPEPQGELIDLQTGQVLGAWKHSVEEASTTGYALSPEGSLLAGSSQQVDAQGQVQRRQIKLWRLPQGTEVVRDFDWPQDESQIPAKERALPRLRFSSDGEKLAAQANAEQSVELVVWEVSSGKRLMFGHLDKIGSDARPAFIDGGKTLVTALQGKQLVLWDVAAGTKRETQDLPLVLMGDLAVDAAGRNLAALSTADSEPRGRFHVLVWDTQQRREVRRLPLDTLAKSLAFDPSGQRLAVGDFRGDVTVFDLTTGQVAFRLPAAHNHTITSVAWWADGRHLVSSGFDGVLRVWQLPNDRPLRRIDLPQMGLFSSLAATPDGERMVIWVDKIQRVVDRDGSVVCEVPGAGITELRADGRKLAIVSAGNITLHDLPAGPATKFGNAGGLMIQSLRFDAQGLVVVAGLLLETNQLAVRRLSPTDPTAIADLLIVPLPKGKLGAAMLSADAGLLAVNVGDITAMDFEIWDIRAGRKLGALPPTSQATRFLQVTFSPDNRYAAVARVRLHSRTLDIAEAADSDAVELYHLPGLERVHTLFVDSMPAMTSFSPDGATLLVGTRNGIVQLVDVVTGEELLRWDRRCGLPEAVIGFAGNAIAFRNHDAGIVLLEMPLLRSRLKEHGLDWHDRPAP